MRREVFLGKDQKKISVCVWDNTTKPKVIIQLIHGMCEHAACYDVWGQDLNKMDYILIGDDHRAHGETDPNALGLAGDGDLFEDTVTDEIGITEYYSQKYHLPVILYGFSYGSFLTQRYLTRSTAHLAGAMICGSALIPGIVTGLGYFVASLACLKYKDSPGEIFNLITFKYYDWCIGGGKFSFVCSLQKKIDDYIKDPMCGFTCSYGFYKYFMQGLRTTAAASLNNVPKTLPILILSGEKDYVGDCGKLVKKLHEKYTKAGLNSQMKLYANARHDIINDVCKEEFYRDSTNFIESSLQNLKN